MKKHFIERYKELISEIIQTNASDISLSIYNNMGSYIPSKKEFKDFNIIQTHNSHFIGETNENVPHGYGVGINHKGNIY